MFLALTSAARLHWESFTILNGRKLSFFYNMEWRRLIQGGTTNQPVPDPAHMARLQFSTRPRYADVIDVPSASQVAASVLAKNCPKWRAFRQVLSKAQHFQTIRFPLV